MFIYNTRDQNQGLMHAKFLLSRLSNFKYLNLSGLTIISTTVQQQTENCPINSSHQGLGLGNYYYLISSKVLSQAFSLNIILKLQISIDVYIPFS